MPIDTINGHYYPPVTDIISADDLPEFLSFMGTALQSVTDRLHYKNFNYSKSANGDGAGYHLELISKKRLDFPIFNTGIYFILNPDAEDGSISTFYISLQYQWRILAFLRSFNIKNFSFSPEGFYRLGLQVFRISEDEAVSQAIKMFVYPAEGVTLLEQVINAINTAYSQSFTLPAEETGVFKYIEETVVPVLNETVSTIVFSSFIKNGDLDISKEKLHTYFNSLVPGGVEAYIRKLITPKARASFSLTAALEFPRNMLQPLDSGGNIITADAMGNPKVRLEFASADFAVDTEKGFEYQAQFEGNLSHGAMIGNTGFSINFQQLKLDLSKTTNIPEADADGRSPDFTGVFVKDATIGFPAFWNHDAAGSTAYLKGTNLIIGTGGISGTVSLAATLVDGVANAHPASLFTLGDSAGDGFSLSIDRFEMEFKLGAIVRSEIKGTMHIPGFKDSTGDDAHLKVTVFAGNNGDFRITVAEDDGIQALGIEGVFSLTIKSVTLGRENGRWYIEAAGSLQITANIPGIETDAFEKPIDIKKVRIWQDGSMEFIGGSIPLPTQIKIGFGPVSLGLNNISFNPHEAVYRGITRRYFCFGFNGALNTGPGGVEVRGNGIEYHFTRDNNNLPLSDAEARPLHTYVRIGGIEVDIKIPGNASPEDADILIKGWLNINTAEEGDAGGDEYSGGVLVDIRKGLGIKGKAGMRMKPKVPAWIVDVELEPGTPTPIAATGLGLYGYRGLVGDHYVASKSAINLPEDALWYEYLKKKVQGINLPKFDPKKEGFSFGLGASIATMGDNGFVFSSRVLLLISIPEMLLIEGKANVLHKRLGLNDTDEPPFYAYLVVDKQSIQAGLGVNYKLPGSGAILSIKGELQLAYFFSNSSAWYINIGKDLPEEKRVQARILTLFSGYAYLMISPRMIKAGAGAKFELKKKAGPVRIGFYAFLDMSGFISFKPIQIGGAIAVGGGLYIKVFGIGLEFHIELGLSAEAPKPFVLAGYFEVRFKIFFKKIRVRVSFTIKINSQLQTTEEPVFIESAGAQGNNGGANGLIPYKAVNMLSEETFGLYFSPNGTLPDPVSVQGWSECEIPMDSYIDIEFKRPVKPYTNRFGGGRAPLPGFTQNVAPRKAKMPQVTHEFRVEGVGAAPGVQIKIWKPATPGSPAAWVDYNMWEAMSVNFAVNGLNINTGTYNYGYWQYNNIAGKYSSLRLLSETPFSVSNAVPPEYFGLTYRHLLCTISQSLKICQNWLTVSRATVYEAGVITRDRQLAIRVDNDDAVIASFPNIFAFAYSLKILPGNKLEIYFPDTMVRLYLKLTCLAGVTISVWRKTTDPDYNFSGVGNNGTDINGLPGWTYENVSTTLYTQSNLNGEIVINAPKIDKIVIEPGACPQNPAVLYNSYWSVLYQQLQDRLEDNDITDDTIALIERWVQLFWQHPLLYGSDDLDRWYKIWKKMLTSPLFDNHDDQILEEWVELYEEYDQDPDHLKKGTPFPDNGACSKWYNYVNDIKYTGNFRSFVQILIDTYCNATPPQHSNSVCSLYVHSVCWKTYSGQQTDLLLSQNGQASINNDINTLVETIDQSLPVIWRPDSYFAIIINTKDDVKVDNTINTFYNRSTVLGFKTGKTLGFKHFSDKLSNLQHYIDYERSYPDPTGKLLQAKPLYYFDPTLELFFTKRYVYEFFMTWGEYASNPARDYKLVPVIMDPAIKSDTPVLTLDPIGWQLRQSTEVPVDSPEIEITSNILVNSNGLNCVGTFVRLNPKTMSTGPISPGELKPEKLYTALFKAKLNETEAETLVHSYVFRTSKYRDFTTHINSYYRPVTNIANGLSTTVKAIYPLNLSMNSASLRTTRLLIQKLILKTLDPADILYRNFAHDYDRIVYGVFQLESETAVTDVEIHVIRAVLPKRELPVVEDEPIIIRGGQLPVRNNLLNEGKNILGVLIKSPEPFNDPRLPRNEMVKTVKILDANNVEITDGSYLVNFSKDNSCIFITNETVSLPATRISVLFNHIFFDGINYSTGDSVAIPIFLNRV